MPEVTQHGRPYMEPERHDELSDGVPRQAPTQKRGGKDFVAGEAATREAASRGGASHKGRTRLSHRIDGAQLTEVSRRRARVLRKAASGEIAATVGGGRCGVIASLFVKFASQKTAAAEEAFERGDYETHRKLTESARMDVLYAREHAAKEAKARDERGSPADVPWLTQGGAAK